MSELVAEYTKRQDDTSQKTEAYRCYDVMKINESCGSRFCQREYCDA